MNQKTNETVNKMLTPHTNLLYMYVPSSAGIKLTLIRVGLKFRPIKRFMASDLGRNGTSYMYMYCISIDYPSEWPSILLTHHLPAGHHQSIRGQ